MECPGWHLAWIGQIEGQHAHRRRFRLIHFRGVNKPAVADALAETTHVVCDGLHHEHQPVRPLLVVRVIPRASRVGNAEREERAELVCLDCGGAEYAARARIRGRAGSGVSEELAVRC